MSDRAKEQGRETQLAAGAGYWIARETAVAPVQRGVSVT